MKKRFTKLAAAFALLALLIPFAGWGQTSVTLWSEDFSSYSANDVPSGGPYSYVCTDGNGGTTTKIYNESTAGGSAPELLVAKKGSGTNGVGGTFTAVIPLDNIEGTLTLTYYQNKQKLSVSSTTAGVSGGQDIKPSEVGQQTTTFTGITTSMTSITIVFQATTTSNVRLDNIVLTGTQAGGSQPQTYTVTYAAGDHGTGTMTDSNTYTSGATVTLLPNAFTPDNGYQWDAWEVKDANNQTVSVNNGTFTMPASNVTVTAQWTQTGGGTGNTITITQAQVTNFTNTYAWYDWSANDVSGKMYAYKNNGMQFNSTKDGYWVYNTSAVPGRITSITMTKASGTDRSWTLKVGNTTLTNTNDGTAMGGAQTVGTSGATWEVTGNYSYFLLYVSGGSTVISDIVINYEEVTAPIITFEPASINLGNVQVGQEVSTTFSVSQANLTSGVSLIANVGSLSVSNIEQGASATQVTWTYTPSAAGAIDVTITATSGTLSETLNITGTAKAAHNITVATMTNGSVTASPNSAIEGETITLTVTPSEGYKLEELTVTNTLTEEQVTVTNNTFEMPNADVTVDATFTAIQTLTVAEALDSSNDYPLNGVYVSGIISQIEEVNTSYHNATYYISDDGTQNNELYVFRGKNLGNTDFNSTNDILVGDQVVVFGNVIDYQGTIEFATNNYIYSRIPAAHYTINFYVNGQMDNGLQMSILQSPNAVLGTLPTPAASSIPAGYEFYGWMVKTANEYYNATTAPEIVDANTSVSGDMDLAAVFRIGTTEGGWTLSNTAPEADEEVILATLSSDKYYAFFADGNGASATEITVSDNVITNAPQTVWTCSDGSTTVSGTVYNGLGFSREGVNGNLHFNSGAIKVANGYGNGLFEFSAISGTSAFTMYGFLNDRYLTYNNSFGVSAESDDACPVYVFKFVGGETTYSDYTTRVFTLPITGYGTSTGGYYLIASPVSTTPEAAGMITDNEGANATPDNATYDLYYFDQAQDLEWINYRQGEFDLVPGKGYLYANKNDVTLTFAGEPSTTSSATLSLSGDGDFAGWNLVGNPFSVPAYIGSRAYYRIGNGGADIVAATAGTAIDVMEGVFVIANENNEVLNFSTTAAKGASVAMNVVRERGNVIDRAIVRFDEGDQLPKFQLNPNNTKIYVTEGNKDYAVVRSAAEAEMPVSFRASENGTYTLAIEAENVEMNYLHLIDNLTGIDVDLLQTPSYTFEAKTSDYASRFRLVFKANGTNENNAETFAYFNGTNWTVSNVGDATLQVVDVTGRTVANQMINGNAELNLNQPAGVYVIRLVNGDNVKTQKVVVR